MKVLLIINNLSKGGAETLLLNFVKAAVKRGEFVFELLILENVIHPSNRALLDETGIRYHVLGEKGLYDPVRILKGLTVFFRNNQFGCIHVHLFPVMYWLAVLKFAGMVKPPMIFTEHSNKNKRIGKWYFKPLEKFVYAQYKKIICVSGSVYETLRNAGIKESKLVIVNNGIDLKKPGAVSDIRKELSLKQEQKLVLMVARFEPNKDHITLVKAIAQLADHSITVLLAGEGRTTEDVKALVDENGLKDRFYFLGVRHDVRSLMAQVDLNLLSTEYEGLSGVAVESMASSKPFLGTDVVGVKEVVGDTKGLFMYRNVNDLAFKINELLYNRERIAENVTMNETRVKLFDIDHMIEQHYLLYRSLTTNQPNQTAE